MQTELTQPGPLLQPDGKLAQIGWARQPVLDCNLEVRPLLCPAALCNASASNAGTTTRSSPRAVSSPPPSPTWAMPATSLSITLDFETGDLHEEGLVIPLGKGIELPRNSSEGNSHFEDKRVRLDFSLHPDHRHLSVSWPAFHDGRGIAGRDRPVNAARVRVDGHRHPHREKTVLLQPQDQLPARQRQRCAMGTSRKNSNQMKVWALWIGDAASGNTSPSGTGPALPASCPMAAPSA